MNGNTLTVGEILEAFPDEAREMVPRCQTRVRRELKPWFAEAKRINKIWCSDFERWFMLRVLDMDKPHDKFAHLLNLEKMIRIMEKPTTDRITEQDIEQAKSAAIYPLYSWSIVKGRPQKFMTKCIFHPDKTASFGVTGGKFHCFGCGVKGDAIAFVQKTMALSFPQAVKYLCKK